MLDPILNWSLDSHQTVYRRIIAPPPAPPPNFADTYVDILADEVDLFVDNHEPYFTLEGMSERNFPSFEPYRDFHDRPSGDWLTNSATFETELVGVDEQNDVIESWTGIGVNFTWSSNAVSAGGIGYSGIDHGGPPIISGGVFDVFQDFVLAGDYNNNNVVDAADYTVWRNNLGAELSLPNETLSKGVVDREDFNAWKANYGSAEAARGSRLGRGASSGTGKRRPPGNRD